MLFQVEKQWKTIARRRYLANRKRILSYGGEHSVFYRRDHYIDNLYSINLLVLAGVQKVGATEGDANEFHSKCMLIRNSCSYIV